MLPRPGDGGDPGMAHVRRSNWEMVTVRTVKITVGSDISCEPSIAVR